MEKKLKKLEGKDKKGAKGDREGGLGLQALPQGPEEEGQATQ